MRHLLLKRGNNKPKKKEKRELIYDVRRTTYDFGPPYRSRRGTRRAIVTFYCAQKWQWARKYGNCVLEERAREGKWEINNDKLPMLAITTNRARTGDKVQLTGVYGDPLGQEREEGLPEAT